MKKFLLLIHGPMGSGKTTVSDLLHDKLSGTALVGLDRIKRFVSGFKRNKTHNETVRNVILAMTNEYLRQNINVIVEQAFKPEHVAVFRKLAKKQKARFFMFQLEAPRDILLERVNGRRHKKTGRPKITQARILRNMRLFERIKFKDTPMFDSSKLSAKVIANKILKDVRRPDGNNI